MNIRELRNLKERLDRENAELSKTMEGNSEQIAVWRKNKDTLAIIDDRIEQINRAILRLKNDSQLGKKFQSKTFANWDMQRLPRAYRICYKYALNFDELSASGKGLILMGSAGTGKTHLASAVSNYLMDELIPVKFGTFISLLDSLKKAFRTDRDIISNLVSTPLLVIDDLGKEKYTEWVSQILFQVVDERYNRELPIIITTNLNLQELKERVGEPITSRLMEMCFGVAMNGENYRYEKTIHGVRQSRSES